MDFLKPDGDGGTAIINTGGGTGCIKGYGDGYIYPDGWIRAIDTPT